ncbi:MAG TPA: hypothetical protein VME92_05320 [Acetobacteraceae bacterium]|nr:hypothetical protein [Acetobacteraceae bacterium]
MLGELGYDAATLVGLRESGAMENISARRPVLIVRDGVPTYCDLSFEIK